MLPRVWLFSLTCIGKMHLCLDAEQIPVDVDEYVCDSIFGIDGVVLAAALSSYPTCSMVYWPEIQAIIRLQSSPDMGLSKTILQSTAT